LVYQRPDRLLRIQRPGAEAASRAIMNHSSGGQMKELWGDPVAGLNRMEPCGLGAKPLLTTLV